MPPEGRAGRARPRRFATLAAAGQTLEYHRIAGATDRPVLVFLHEGLGCITTWKDFPAWLVSRTRCPALLYSRAGYGGSSPVVLPRPIDYMEPEGLAVLPAVLDAADVGRCILIGHSDGASIALVNAGGVGDPRVTGLVLMAPHLFAEAHGIEGIRRARDAFERGELRRRLHRHHGTNVDGAFWGWCNTWLEGDFMAWNIERYLLGIAVPILQIQGLDDEYGTLLQLRRIEAGVRGRVTTLALAECGHAPHLEQPGPTLDAISSFVHDLAGDGGC